MEPNLAGASGGSSMIEFRGLTKRFGTKVAVDARGHHGALLPAWAGGLVLLAYAAVIGLLASAATLRRDLT
jgi:hypothetical protein